LRCHDRAFIVPSDDGTFRHDLVVTNSTRKEVPEMLTETYAMPALDAAVKLRAQVSTWAAPMQGTLMPFPAARLHSIAVVSDATGIDTANAAQGATKNAQGDEAFEDPV
jgi:hypothetical protein